MVGGNILLAAGSQRHERAISSRYGRPDLLAVLGPAEAPSGATPGQGVPATLRALPGDATLPCRRLAQPIRRGHVPASFLLARLRRLREERQLFKQWWRV